MNNNDYGINVDVKYKYPSGVFSVSQCDALESAIDLVLSRLLEAGQPTIIVSREAIMNAVWDAHLLLS